MSPHFGKMILLGLDALARATAKATDSLLEDVEREITNTGRKVQRARKGIRRKVAESGVIVDVPREPSGDGDA